MAEVKEIQDTKQVIEKATALDWFNSNIKSIENQLGQYFLPEEFKQFKRFMKLLCTNNFKNVKSRNAGNKNLKISSRMFSKIVDSEGMVNVTKFKRFFVNIAKMMKGIEANNEKEANEALAEAENEAFETKEESNEFFVTLLEHSKFGKNKTSNAKENADKSKDKTDRPTKKLGDRLEELLEASQKAKTENQATSETHK